MSLFARFILSLVVAVAISGVYMSLVQNQSPGFVFDLSAAIAFALTAAISVALTVQRGSGQPGAGQKSSSTTGTSKSGSSRPASPKSGKGKRQTGTVKWFNGSKGFGFIAAEDGEEYFVHFRSVRKDSKRLTPDKKVEFTLVQGKKGAEADDVFVL